MGELLVSGRVIAGLGRLVVWIPGIPENERDWDSWVYGVPLESQTTGPQTNN